MKDKDKEIRLLSEHLDIYVECFQFVVDNYGIAEVLVTQSPMDGGVINDYVYFCFTKSCKTLMAIQLLVTNGFPEDTISLVRTLYENYLNIAYILNNPQTVDLLVRRNLGVSTGHYKFAKNKAGRINRRKIIDPSTNLQMPFGISTKELANGTSLEEDAKLHEILYPYFCEYIHPNMVSSGSYRKKSEHTFYSYKNIENTFQALIYTLYLGTLILDCILSYEELEPDFEQHLQEIIIEGADLISFVLNSLNFPDDISEKSKVMVMAINERLKLISQDAN